MAAAIADVRLASWSRAEPARRNASRCDIKSSVERLALAIAAC